MDFFSSDFPDYPTWYEEKKEEEKWVKRILVSVGVIFLVVKFGPDVIAKAKQLLSPTPNKKPVEEVKTANTQEPRKMHEDESQAAIIAQLITVGQTNLLGTLGLNENRIIINSIVTSGIFNSIYIFNIADSRELDIEVFSCLDTDAKIYITRRGSFDGNAEKMKTDMRLVNSVKSTVSDVVDLVGNAVSKIKTKGAVRVSVSKSLERKERLNKKQNVSNLKIMSKVTNYEDIMKKPEVQGCDLIIINKINSFCEKCTNILPDVYERIIKPAVDNNQTLLLFSDLTEKGKFYGGEYVSKNANTAWVQEYINTNTRAFVNKHLDYSGMPLRVAYKIVTTDNGKEVMVPVSSEDNIKPDTEAKKQKLVPLIDKYFEGKDEVLFTDLLAFLSVYKYDLGSIKNVLTAKVGTHEIINPDGEGAKWVRIKITPLNQNDTASPPDADGQEKPETVWMM